MQQRIVRSARARGIRARVTIDGILLITAGNAVTDSEIDAFLARHARWLANREREAVEYRDYVSRYGGENCIMLHGVSTPVRYIEGEGESRYDGSSVTIYHSGDTESALDEWLEGYAREYITAIYSAVSGNVVPMKVKRVRSYYGICRRRGGSSYICLNSALIHGSDECIRHVIYHELTHLVVPNHSKAFYRELARVEPRHREYEAELRRTVKIC